VFPAGITVVGGAAGAAEVRAAVFGRAGRFDVRADAEQPGPADYDVHRPDAQLTAACAQRNSL
jgi:hypothetical protein